MAKFSFHCENYKQGQLGGLDKHNRRLNKHYSNNDVDLERSKHNRVYIAPQETLYKDCKKIIEEKVVANGGRITKASNWICECIFTFSEEFEISRLDEYNSLIISYFSKRFGKEKILSAICHTDEGGLPHLHLDLVPLTDDNRLSAKTLINRDFITNMHRVMPIILQKHGFDVDAYEETEEKKFGGLSAKEYKKKMDKERKELNEKLDEMTEEYNRLVDKYNEQVKTLEALENENYIKTVEILNEREEYR